MKSVDLSKFVSGDVRVLIGHDRGLAIRNAAGLDSLDADPDRVEIILPQSLRTLTPSFVQGLIAESIKHLGEGRFFEHYRFDAADHLIEDVRAGIDRVLTSRHLAGVN